MNNKCIIKKVLNLNHQTMEIKLRQIREERGISQEQMAQYLKISQPQYYRKEKGSSKILESEWDIISSILGVDKNEIQNKKLGTHTIKEDNTISCSQLLSASETLVFELKEHVKTLKEKIIFVKGQYELRLKDKEEIIILLKQSKKD